MPLMFDPGEAFKFDWSHELVLLAGMPVTVKVAQFTLCYSRMPFVRCYPRETREMVFDAHDRAFAAFGGHCGRGIYDNMSTAVTRVLLGWNREINRRFLQMCAHYVITPEFCTPRSGWEKGRVERQIGTLRTVLFKPRPSVETLACLNGQLAQQCLSHAREHPYPDFPEMSVFEVYAREEQRLPGAGDSTLPGPCGAPDDGLEDLPDPLRQQQAAGCAGRAERHRVWILPRHVGNDHGESIPGAVEHALQEACSIRHGPGSR